MYTTGNDVKRACAFITASIDGGVVYDSSKVTGFTETAYPFPILPGITKVTVNCPNLLCAINCHHDENGVVTQVDDGHWSAVGGETNYDISSFVANGATHVSIGFKNSANTSLAGTTIDSTTVAISFS